MISNIWNWWLISSCDDFLKKIGTIFGSSILVNGTYVRLYEYDKKLQSNMFIGYKHVLNINNIIRIFYGRPATAVVFLLFIINNIPTTYSYNLQLTYYQLTWIL